MCSNSSTQHPFTTQCTLTWENRSTVWNLFSSSADLQEKATSVTTELHWALFLITIHLQRTRYLCLRSPRQEFSPCTRPTRILWIVDVRFIETRSWLDLSTSVWLLKISPSHVHFSKSQAICFKDNAFQHPHAFCCGPIHAVPKVTSNAKDGTVCCWHTRHETSALEPLWTEPNDPFTPGMNWQLVANREVPVIISVQILGWCGGVLWLYHEFEMNWMHKMQLDHYFATIYPFFACVNWTGR